MKKKNSFIKLLYLLAEWEAFGIRPGERALWRQLFLKSLKSKYGKTFYIGKGFWIHYGCNLKFGNRCSFGEFCKIMDHGPIQIGDDFIAATGLQINSGSHDLETMRPVISEIRIGDRVWCGANVTIVAGAEIESDVVIGAGSLVKNKIPAGVLAAGVPARVIREIKRTKNRSLWTWASE